MIAALAILLSAFLRVVSPRRGRVFFASIPDFADNAFSMYRHLITSCDGIEIVWAVRDPAVADSIAAHFSRTNTGPSNRLRVRRWNDPRTYLAYIRSEIVFHTHGVYSFSPQTPRRTIVSLWHGMPIKAIGAIDEPGDWHGGVHGDVHIATSQMFRCVVAAAFEVSPRAVLTTGLPRCDVLKGHVRPDHDRGEVLRALALPLDQRLLLWMPTHRVDSGAGPESSFLDDVDEPTVRRLLDEGVDRGCRLLVKLHPYEKGGEAIPPWLRDHPAVSIVSSTNWRDTGVQLYDLLAAADGLLTDISSVLIDYLYTGRPIGLIGFDEGAYGRELVIPLSVLAECDAVSTLDDADGVRAFVSSVAEGRAVRSLSGVASMLGADGDSRSCESIARHVGLS